jgi:predicted Zn-dependent peptidase
MRFYSGRLHNGLQFIVVPDHTENVATFFVGVRAGTRYENAAVQGVAHFLEHMLFKGSVNFPTPQAIAAALDSVGGEFNGFTEREYVGYYAKVPSRNISLAVEVISDLVKHPLLRKEDVRKERKVIIEEMRMYADMPQQHVADLFARLLFGPQSLGWSAVGRQQTIKRISDRILRSFWRKHYVARNMVALLAGRVTIREARRLLQQHLGSLARGHKVTPPALQRLPSRRWVSERRSLDQLHLILGVPGVKAGSPRRPAVEVLTTALGGGMSSRLFQEIRERRALAYYIHASAEFYVPTGMLTIVCGCNPQRAAELGEALREQLNNVCAEVFPARELKRAQRYLCGRLAVSLETSDRQAAFLAAQALLSLPLRRPAYFQRQYRAVTGWELRQTARHFWRQGRWRVAAVGSDSALRHLRKAMGV